MSSGQLACELEQIAFDWSQAFTPKPEAAFAVANAFGFWGEFD